MMKVGETYKYIYVKMLMILRINTAKEREKMCKGRKKDGGICGEWRF